MSKMACSHTPLVAMSSGLLLPDLYCKIKANTNSITLKTENNEKSLRLVHYTGIICSGWVGSRQWQTQPKQMPTQQVT